MSAFDGQNTENPVNPSDDTQPQRAVNILQEATGSQSRRKFLRAAVMSGVGVATVAATAGVAAACQSAVPSVFGQEGTMNTASGTDPCVMCFESSGFDDLTEFTVFETGNGWQTNPGTFYLFFVARNVPAGTYSISVNQDPNASPFTQAAKSNSDKLFQLDANSTATECPYTLPNEANANGHKYANTVAGLNTYQFTGVNQDLVYAFHFVWRNDVPLATQTPYSFTAILTGNNGVSRTCKVTVTAKPGSAPTATPTP